MTRLFERGQPAYGKVSPALLRTAVRTLTQTHAATPYDLAVALGAPLAEVEPIWQSMLDDGYFARHPKWGYVPAVKINDLLHLRVGRALSRPKAEALLRQLVANAKAINALPDRHHVFRIAQLAVFGSYLDPDRTELGDLDIAWTEERRPEQLLHMRGITHATYDSESGTRALLRPKGPYVKLQAMREVLRLECPYRIFFDASAPTA